MPFNSSSLLFSFSFQLWTFPFFRPLFTKSVLHYCLISPPWPSILLQHRGPLCVCLKDLTEVHLLCHVFPRALVNSCSPLLSWWRLLPVTVLCPSLIIVWSLVLVCVCCFCLGVCHFCLGWVLQCLKTGPCLCVLGLFLSHGFSVSSYLVSYKYVPLRFYTMSIDCFENMFSSVKRFPKYPIWFSLVARVPVGTVVLVYCSSSTSNGSTLGSLSLCQYEFLKVWYK